MGTNVNTDIKAQLRPAREIARSSRRSKASEYGRPRPKKKPAESRSWLPLALLRLAGGNRALREMK